MLLFSVLCWHKNCLRIAFLLTHITSHKIVKLTGEVQL